ncbi:helix-turn-helix transcriptional regulator [Acinetobacter baumannii]|nr:helix-turn-helix transcriptional regulator [Acinetobacter baumannii]EHU3378823.1 helix-turn-helix transcriptional regulator [Acinetobacter baumannii]EHU3391299.1 helix-turn-helix transcriptional regulator [Acinetobacter baumannii]
MKSLSPISIVRRKNTLNLMKRNGLERKDLADKLNMGYSLLSSYIGKNPSKGIGDEVAGRIAEVFGVEPSYIDTDHELIEKYTLQTNAVSDKKTPDDSDVVSVPFYPNVYASCGPGMFNDANEYEVSTIKIDRCKLRERQIDPSCVRSFLSEGHSMSPLIPHRAEVFCDVSRTEIKDEGIFAVCHGGLFKIKKLFKAPNGGVRLVSTNTNKDEYPDEILTAEQIKNEAFHVVGQVFHVNHTIPF